MNPIAPTSPPATMTPMKQTFREIILNRLAELKWEKYRLAEACHAQGVHRDIVYKYLRGDSETNTQNLKTMFTVLGLKVAKGPKPKKLPKRAGDATA